MACSEPRTAESQTSRRFEGPSPSVEGLLSSQALSEATIILGNDSEDEEDTGTCRCKCGGSPNHCRRPQRPGSAFGLTPRACRILDEHMFQAIETELLHRSRGLSPPRCTTREPRSITPSLPEIYKTPSDYGRLEGIGIHGIIAKRQQRQAMARAFHIESRKSRKGPKGFQKPRQSTHRMRTRSKEPKNLMEFHRELTFTGRSSQSRFLLPEETLMQFMVGIPVRD